MSAPSPGVAAVLSLFIPGLGQLYQGKLLSGLLWMLFTAAGYFFIIIPGIILHFLCVATALSHKTSPQQVVVVQQNSGDTNSRK